jgi:glycosyltransferase involved in cell wall biosynthesis
MRIGIDASPLYMRKSGISSYLESLLGGMAELGAGHSFVLYTNRPLPADRVPGGPFEERLARRPLPSHQLWFQLGLPAGMRRDGIEVFLGPFHRLPLLSGVPSVLVVHDLSGLLLRRLHTRHVIARDMLIPLFVRRARRIVAVSRFTRRELLDRFRGVGGKVDVVPEAPGADMHRVEDPAELERVRRRLDLPARYILFLGTLEPRKNLPRLVRCFASVAGRLEQDLVLAGSMGWKEGELRRELGDARIRGRVHLTGFVEDADLPALITMADLMAYPSQYEGFGLPVVEAMACGTPVLTSSTSSLPETAGGAAVLVDPGSTESMARGLLRLASDADLRENLSRRGLERAGSLSWRKTASMVLDSCRRARR